VNDEDDWIDAWIDDRREEERNSDPNDFDRGEDQGSIDGDAAILPHDRGAVYRAYLRNEPEWFRKTAYEEAYKTVMENPDGPTGLDDRWKTARVYQLSEEAKTYDTVTFPDDYQHVANVKVLGDGGMHEHMTYISLLMSLALHGEAGSGWVETLTDSKRENKPGDIVELPGGCLYMHDLSEFDWTMVGRQPAIAAPRVDKDMDRDLDR
jgi:hypothetical protein